MPRRRYGEPLTDAPFSRLHAVDRRHEWTDFCESRQPRHSIAERLQSQRSRESGLPLSRRGQRLLQRHCYRRIAWLPKGVLYNSPLVLAGRLAADSSIAAGCAGLLKSRDPCLFAIRRRDISYTKLTLIQRDAKGRRPGKGQAAMVDCGKDVAPIGYPA